MKFVFVQTAIIAALVGTAVVRSRDLERGVSLPEFQNAPLRVNPQYNDPRIVSDEQLAMVLEKLRPRFAGAQPKINHIDHALRFWGLEAEFTDPQCLSGERMLNLLLDHPTFAAAWGEETRPLLIRGARGVSVRTARGEATASHIDHTLGTLAEIGVPLNSLVTTAAGETTLNAVLTQALYDFRLNQREYEWTALALGLYAPGDQPWITQEGQQITFDLLAQRITRQDYAQGVCYGNHRLYTLAILLRVDDHHRIFSPDARRAVMHYLSGATRRLVGSQSSEGWWDRNWPGGEVVEKGSLTALSRRLLATGHALEWWAMAPAELHPPRETLARAGQWLVREIENMDAQTIEKNYTFLSHVGRALALWRGGFAAELKEQLK